MKKITIMGIDPGLASFGLAIIECEPGARAIVDARVFLSDSSATKHGVAKADDRFRRARDLKRFLTDAIAECSPDLVACEAMSFPRGAQAVAAIALAWGVIAACCDHLPVVQAQPRTWRKYHDASGSEKLAHKSIREIETGGSILDELSKSRQPHAYDAAGVALWATTTDEFLAIMKGRQR